MATLVQSESGESTWLHTRTVVGRSPAADLRVDSLEVSHEHAVVWWTGEGWHVRDLASRNGTSVDGAKLKPGQDQELCVGSVVVFGEAAPSFQVVDLDAPKVLARSLLNDRVVSETGEMLVLPDGGNPQLTLYRNKSGKWIGESARRIVALADLQLVRVAGDVYRVYLPEPSMATVHMQPKPSIDTVRLRFSHSTDEEYVALEAVTRWEEVLDLKARAHNYLLLLLARKRAEDSAKGGLSTGHGWVYRDQLARMLSTDEATVNVQIYRARRALADAGIDDAALVVESRTGNRQIRIGVGDVEIVEV